MTLHLHATQPAFDPAKPCKTADGRFEAKLHERRRGSDGLVMTLVGYKDDAGNDRKYAYRSDGTLFGTIGDQPLNLVNT